MFCCLPTNHHCCHRIVNNNIIVSAYAAQLCPSQNCINKKHCHQTGVMQRHCKNIVLVNGLIVSNIYHDIFLLTIIIDLCCKTLISLYKSVIDKHWVVTIFNNTFSLCKTPFIVLNSDYVGTVLVFVGHKLSVLLMMCKQQPKRQPCTIYSTVASHRFEAVVSESND
jgi:hypothetical protein